MILPPGTTLQVAQIDDWLERFESKAIEARREAATLESGRRHSWSWQTHVRHLSAMKAQVNEMGRILAKREASKAQATLFQEKAIEAARTFSIPELLRVKRIAMVGGPIGVLLILGTAIAWGTLFGWRMSESLVIGAAISVASTMVMARLLTDSGRLSTTYGRVMLGITPSRTSPSFA